MAACSTRKGGGHHGSRVDLRHLRCLGLEDAMSTINYLIIIIIYKVHLRWFQGYFLGDGKKGLKRL